MRAMVLLLLSAAASQAALQSVEFPFDAFPRQYWERELVWLKNVGIRNVEFPLSADSKSTDDFLRLLRKLELTAWVRLDGMKFLPERLIPQLQSHGGPIAYVEGAQPAPPLPIRRISALSPRALAESRDALAGGSGALLWTDVEDTIAPRFHRGAIAFNGDEQPTLIALRRSAALMQYWGEAMSAGVASGPRVRQVLGEFPPGVTVRQIVMGQTSAVSVVNGAPSSYHGELKVLYPPAKRSIALPAIDVPAGEALWMPLNLPLGSNAMCKDCVALGNDDHLIYATAELTSVEYENGILSMEFCAPAAGEAVLHLSHEPSGPYLAGGKPSSFAWDESTARVRLAIPAGKGASHRVRVGLAIQPPEISAFFVDAKALIIGATTRVSTLYSSEDLAKRSRLKLPQGWKARASTKSPNEIDYDVDVPANTLHGDHAELGLEADGILLSHARLQLLRPASLRIREAVGLHYGTVAELLVVPALIPIDAKAGREISITIRNNFPEIRNFILTAASSELEFSPAQTVISIAGSSERDVVVRVFSDKAEAGLHDAWLKLSGPTMLEMPVRLIVIPRGETVIYTADLDGDGTPETILESLKARAVFSSASGGRWMEFVWKESGRNVLPEGGVPLGPARFELHDSQLAIESNAPLPVDVLKSGKQGDIALEVNPHSPNRAVYTLSR